MSAFRIMTTGFVVPDVDVYGDSDDLNVKKKKKLRNTYSKADFHLLLDCFDYLRTLPLWVSASTDFLSEVLKDIILFVSCVINSAFIFVSTLIL